MKKLLSGLFFTFLLSCFVVTPAFADNDKLASEVMEIHDVAMAKMTMMHELKLQLQELEKAEGVSEETTAAIVALKNAHRAMMQWMRNYKKEQGELSVEQRESYLLEEKIKIQQVSDMINNSIESSESLLKEHG